MQKNKYIIAGIITYERYYFTVKVNKKGKFSLQINFFGFENYVKDVSSTIIFRKNYIKIGY